MNVTGHKASTVCGLEKLWHILDRSLHRVNVPNHHKRYTSLPLAGLESFHEAKPKATKTISVLNIAVTP